MGRRRVKTDGIDLEAITELMLAGRGRAIGQRGVLIGEVTAWAQHRSRRVATRTATKNQLLGQLDRAFPGLAAAVSIQRIALPPETVHILAHVLRDEHIGSRR